MDCCNTHLEGSVALGVLPTASSLGEFPAVRQQLEVAYIGGTLENLAVLRTEHCYQEFADPLGLGAFEAGVP